MYRSKHVINRVSALTILLSAPMGYHRTGSVTVAMLIPAVIAMLGNMVHALRAMADKSAPNASPRSRHPSLYQLH